MPVHWTESFSSIGVVIMGFLGIAFGFFAFRSGSRRQTRVPGDRMHTDLDGLLSEIGRGLRMLSTPSRFGGMGLLREKQYEVERQLGELQRRMRHVEDKVRERYEDRAQRILEQAARYGITLPPP